MDIMFSFSRRECESALSLQHSGPGGARGGQPLQRELRAVQTRAARVLWVQHQQQQSRISPGLKRKKRLECCDAETTRQRKTCEIDILNLIHEQLKIKCVHHRSCET